MDALKRFSIPDEITLTTDGYHYRDALVEISRRVRTRVKRQRCLFQVMKNLSKKIHDACSDEALLDVKNLIRYVFFPTGEEQRGCCIHDNKNGSEGGDIQALKIVSIYRVMSMPEGETRCNKWAIPLSLD